MALDLFHPDNLKHILTSHPPKDQVVSDKLDTITGSLLLTAKIIAAECPPCAERTLALRKLEQCGFYAKAAITRNQGDDETV